jgi:hypothetical protein
VAITLDVITKVVDGSLRDSSNTVERHFARAGEQAGTGFSKSFSKSITNSSELQKSFDKAADAAGKLRVEQQKLNELQEKGTGGAKLIAQQERLAKVTRETQRAVRDTADTFQSADRAAGSMLSTLSNITAGTRIGGLTAQASSLASSLSGVGLATGVAIGGFTALAVGAIAAANKLYDMGKAWDDISDGITARTGKVGAELQAITDQVAQVGNSTAATHEELGSIAAQAVQSLRLSGNELGAMMKQLAELNNLTGEQTNVRGLGMIFRMFKVDAQDQIPFLNELYGTFQKMGIPVNDLIATLDKGGTVLSGFGMSATQAAATIALFEQAGVPADQALRGLTTAFKNLNAAGKDPAQGLREMVTQIKALHDAGNDLGSGGSRDLAEQYFGKGFGPILQSIIDGRFEIDKLPTSVDNTRTSIDDATKATEDFSESWRKLSNQFGSLLKPAAAGFFDFLNDALINTQDLAVNTIAGMALAFNKLRNDDGIIGSIMSAFGLGPTGMVGGGGGFDGSPDTGGAGTSGAASSSTRTGSNQGLTPNSLNAKGAIESAFPAVTSIGGFRPPDVTPNGTFTEHSSGQAIDVMVPNWNTPQGKSYGEQIKQYALANAASLGVDYVLWQQTQWNADGSSSPMGDRGSPTQNHMDHVHIHTAKGNAGGGGNPGHGGYADRARGGMSPVGPTAAPSNVGPGSSPSSPSVADFPAAADVGPASATTTPVQMVPSPFGPQYAPVPAGSTPGYNETGKAGTFLPDSGRVKSATKQYENALDNINKANEAIADAKARQVEIENNITSDSKQRADAAKNVADAEKRLGELTEAAGEAQDALAQAKLGTFREAQKAQQAKSGGLGDVGASLADDFGISEGLPGIAKWFTTYLANLAFAPMIGQLSAVSAANPIKGGSGLLGMMGAQNIAATGNVLGNIGPGPLGGGVVGPGTGTSDSIPAMLSNGEYVLPADTVNGMGGPGGVSSLVQGYAEGGPVTDMQSVPQSTQGGSGFQGLGGMPMQAITTAVAAAGPALDAIAPGASQAAQIGVQLANRTAAFAGQLAGIGVSGLLETFLPHGSPIADPGKSWLGKIASGFAGARPALPNTAGQQSPAGQPAPAQTPEQAAALNAQTTQPNSPMVNIEQMNNNTPDGGRTIADQVAWHGMVANGAGGPR